MYYTNFYKLSETVYFYQVIFNRFYFIMFSVRVGQNLVLGKKNTLRAKGLNKLALALYTCSSDFRIP